MNRGWLKSCPCTQAQLESATFQGWRERFKHHQVLHRKLWEWCFIAQALGERGLLAPGKRGLGFAVGTEPLAALFAEYGCLIVGSDQARERAEQLGWVGSNQHAGELQALLRPDICEPKKFYRQVSFRVVDMNDIPPDLRDFDFVWSACSFEHLGDIPRGLRFLFNMLDCLRPGGVAVHTTEYNVSSNDATISEGGFVLFRRRDLEGVAEELRRAGHEIEIDFETGSGPVDQVIDREPYTHNPHLKLELCGHVATSLGVIITKAASGRLSLRFAGPLLRPLRAVGRRVRRLFASRPRQTA